MVTRRRASGSRRGRSSGARARGGGGRTRRRGGRGAGGLGLRLLALALAGIALAGVGTVKFLQSPRGRIALLDAGRFAHYATVQDDIGMAMHRALERFGLDGAITERVLRRRDDAGYPLAWRVECGRDADLLRINAALTAAVEAIGARVRRGVEAGDDVVLEVGTVRHLTHRVVLTPRGAGPRPRDALAARGPGGRRGGADGLTREGWTQGRGGDGSREGAPGPTGGMPDDGPTAPRLAIVIDDFGYALGGVPGRLLALDAPLTVAILPTLPHSREVYARARRAGRCVLLHLPMESDRHEPTDVEPVTVSMSSADIESTVARYLDALGPVDGVNNHQGSRATADARVVDAVLDVIAARGLFLLDSLTSPKSLAYARARARGVPALRNALFLDDGTSDPEEVARRVRRLAESARRHGAAIGIGHPHRWTLEALERELPRLRESGVELVGACDLVGATTPGTAPGTTGAAASGAAPRKTP